MILNLKALYKLPEAHSFYELKELIRYFTLEIR